MNQQDRGSTILEVLIAIMIFGTTSLAVAGSLMTTRGISDRLISKANAVRSLNQAAQGVVATPFAACSGAQGSYQVPSGFTLVVKVMKSGGTWGECTSLDSAAKIQLVTVTLNWRGTLLTRTILKAPES